MAGIVHFPIYMEYGKLLLWIYILDLQACVPQCLTACTIPQGGDKPQ